MTYYSLIVGEPFSCLDFAILAASEHSRYRIREGSPKDKTPLYMRSINYDTYRMEWTCKQAESMVFSDREIALSFLHLARALYPRNKFYLTGSK
jgi:hypothetical protein